MIRLDTVSLGYGNKTLLDDVSLHIRRSDRIGLIGPNGTGKSSLFKLICNLTDSYSGEIIRTKGVTVGYLPQEGFAFKKKTVFEEALSAFEDAISLKKQLDVVQSKLEDSGISGEEHMILLDQYAHLRHQLEVTNSSKINAETSKVLKGIGFRESDFEKPIDTFSGGWQMRVALSRLLLQDPNLLLLDEPTNHLDIDSILWLEDYLKEFRGGLIVISHDKTFLDRNITRIWELEKGKVNEYHGNYSFYEVEKENRTELQIARYTNQQKKIKQVERFIERFRAKNTKASQVQSRIHMLEKMEKEELPENTVEQVKFRFHPAKQSGVTVLDVKDISHTYDEKLIFRDISFCIERGEKVALVGQNGSGKSTLLRIIAGMERPQSGIVRLGHNVLFDYFAQEHAENLNNHNTVLHEIESDAPFSMIPHLRHILGAFLFSGDDIYKTVNVLSGGEKSRLALAKMLLKPTNFLVLDEPTNHIDITTKKILKKALLDYAGSLLIVSHDRDFLDGLVTKVYELKNGNIHVHLGSFKDFLEKKTSTLHRESQDCRDGSSGAQIKHTADICGNMAEKAKQVLPPKPEKNSLQKQQYLYKKEQNARKRKLEKEIQGIEEKIVLLERQKKELDHILYDPKLYEDKEKSVEINRQYKTVTQELNTLYTQWESVHANLESLIETISSHTSAEG